MSVKAIAILVVLVVAIGGVVVATRNDETEVTATPTPTPTPSAQPTSITGTKPLVRFTNSGPDPEELKIKVGQTVIFRNDSDDPIQPASDPHPQHTNLSGFDSRNPLEKGESFEFTFNKAGAWGFHDHLAPSVKGMIVVE